MTKPGQCDIYITDILGGEFEQLVIPQEDDYEGKVFCTSAKMRRKFKET